MTPKTGRSARAGPSTQDDSQQLRDKPVPSSIVADPGGTSREGDDLRRRG
jgi:hypothetical protein